MCENHHNCIFMNINEKCVLGNQQFKKNGCLPTKMLMSEMLKFEHSVALKMTKIETTVMHGYRAVVLVVNNANIY